MVKSYNNSPRASLFNESSKTLELGKNLFTSFHSSLKIKKSTNKNIAGIQKEMDISKKNLMM